MGITSLTPNLHTVADVGVFNRSRPRALESFRLLAALDVETACFGHGEPNVGGASARL